jgi:hypothetical protein
LNPTAKLAIETAKARPRRGFHVITYNFDTLLEEVICALGHNAIAIAPEVPTAGSILGADASRGSGHLLVRRSFLPAPAQPREERFGRHAGFEPPVTVRVFHPHGLLPRKGSGVGKGLILGASSYDWTAGALQNPHNLWQLSAFSGLSCVFYGLSLNDSAIRRLVRLARVLRENALLSDARHVAVLRQKVTPLDERIQQRLEQLGIATFATQSYCQQKQLLFKAVECVA